MNVKEAAQRAAAYVSELLRIGGDEEFPGGQAFYDFAIEGTKFDDDHKQWQIDVGYVLPWDKAERSGLAALAAGPSSNMDRRTYKRITIPDDGDGPIQMSSMSHA